MKKSTKTTVGGILLCVGLLFSAVGRWISTGEPPGLEALGAIGAAVSALYLGLMARDDNVTSEGRVAPKDTQ